jgi:uncharacterized protein YkvS
MCESLHMRFDCHDRPAGARVRALALAAAIVLSTAAFPAAVGAQQSHEAQSGSEAAAPHGQTVVQTIARLVNFAILGGVLVYFLKTPVGAYLVSRSTQIRQDLVTAAETRATAAAQLTEIERSCRRCRANSRSCGCRANRISGRNRHGSRRLRPPNASMDIKAEEISKIIRDQIGSFAVDVDVAEVGSIISIGDGIARVHGVENAMAGEMLEFPHGVFGIALNLEEDSVGAVLLGEFKEIKEGDRSSAPAASSRCRSATSCSAASSTRSASRSTARARSSRSSSRRSSASRPASSIASR